MDFKTSVINKSHELPVVVDFWAPWCGPCRVLGPVIEQLAAEQQGRWELVKLNTEEEQEIAMQYRIQSIPNVKMFHKGKVIAEFAGALPRSSIMQWLDEHLPDERMDQLEELLDQLEAGDHAALQELENLTAAYPDMKEARLALARHLVFEDAERALALVEDIKLGDPLYDQAEDLQVLGALMTHQPDDSPAGQAIAAARTAIRDGELEAALEAIIRATTVQKDYADDLPRRLGIALFRMLGAAHPLTKSYRWKFDMAIY